MSASVDDDPFGLLAGTLPVEDEDEEREEVADEPKAEKEPEAEADETEAEPEADPGDGEEEDEEPPLAAEAEEAPASEAEKELAEERRRAEGLRKALIEQRRQNRELQQQYVAQAPNPATYGQPPQAPPQAQPEQPPLPAPPPGYEVQVDPSGQQVYVDRGGIQADMQQMLAAHEAAQIQSQTDAMTNAFVAREPEARVPLVREARAADEFVSLKLQNMLMSGEVQANANDPNLAETLIEQLRDVGVIEEVGQFFPNVGRNFDAFFRAWGQKDPYSKMSVLEAMAVNSNSTPPPPKPSRPVRPVTDSPQSMARKGSSRSEVDTDDDREFRNLFSRFVSTPESFSDKDKTRMDALGAKLGKDGFDEE